MKKTLTIGKLALLSEVNVETIRFYERKGILKQPPKQGAFRVYPEDYVARIQFIKRSQALGFNLNEAKSLLDLKIKNQGTCSDVLVKTQDKIEEINKKIKDLKKMKKTLEKLAFCCVDNNQPLSDCPILECFISHKENQ